jgi:hypothetical protein
MKQCVLGGTGLVRRLPQNSGARGVDQMSGSKHWRWSLDEVNFQINGLLHYR